MINFQFYPKNQPTPDNVLSTINVFKENNKKFDSSKHKLVSNDVLRILEPSLKREGYIVESGKKKTDKISIPVLHGLNNKIEKSFDADAYNPKTRTVIEVEAGRALTNYQFLKDIFQASMMENVDYLIIAVRNHYNHRNDFEKINRFLETMYLSKRIDLPLKGIALVGY